MQARRITDEELHRRHLAAAAVFLRHHDQLFYDFFRQEDRMKATFRVLKPESIEMELTVAMPLAAWMELRRGLPAKWPATDLSYQIERMIAKAQEHFRASEESAP